MDVYGIVQNMLSPVLNVVKTIMTGSLLAVAFAAVCFFWWFFIRYRVNFFRLRAEKLASLQIKFKLYDLMRWLLYDLVSGPDRRFREYGFTIYCGRQGSGKTVSMVEYLNRMKALHPDCIIVTNFAYAHADRRMTDWRDLMEIGNGDKGVIFAIDEIHSEYSTNNWKDFPEALLSEISQQRKQKVKIVATAQSFGRIAKPIREQAFSVVQCSTYFGRFTFDDEYDALEYAVCMNNTSRLKGKVKRIRHWSFVHSNALRSCYDTYEKIERMKKTEFLVRSERH